jgi:hypothetical protein
MADNSRNYDLAKLFGVTANTPESTRHAVAEGLRVVKAFAMIRNPETRRMMIELLEHLAQAPQ